MSTSSVVPILVNLGKLLAEYGPVVLRLLVDLGVIQLPAGFTLPTLPANVSSAASPEHLAALNPVQAELRLDALADHAGELNRLYLAARSGNLT